MLGSVMQDQPAPQPEYSEDGVDLSLIRWMLSLTPAERLEVLEEHSNEILAMLEFHAASESH